MSDAEYQANLCLQKRGYLVVTNGFKVKLLPKIIDGAHGPSSYLDHPLVLIAETDHADYVEQSRLLGVSVGDDYGYYYRAKAE